VLRLCGAGQLSIMFVSFRSGAEKRDPGKNPRAGQERRVTARTCLSGLGGRTARDAPVVNVFSPSPGWRGTSLSPESAMECVSRRPSRRIRYHCESNNMRSSRRCARPNARRYCRAPPNTPRVCLLNLPTYDVAGSTAGNALACVRECDEPVRAEWKVSVQKRWPFPCFGHWPKDERQIRILVICLSLWPRPNFAPIGAIWR
jgi:hypothetical protein